MGCQEKRERQTGREAVRDEQVLAGFLLLSMMKLVWIHHSRQSASGEGRSEVGLCARASCTFISKHCPLHRHTASCEGRSSQSQRPVSSRRAEIELRLGDDSSCLRSHQPTRRRWRSELTCYILSGPDGRPCPFPVEKSQRPTVQPEAKTTIRGEKCQHTYVQRGLIINNGELHNVWIHRLGERTQLVNLGRSSKVRHPPFILLYLHHCFIQDKLRVQQMK